MLDCVVRGKHSLYEYTFEKLALIQKLKLPITGADQVNLILGGIPDDQVKFSVEMSGITDPSQLASHFKVLDERQGRLISTPETPKPSTSGARLQGPSKRQQDEKNRVCYRCGAAGHLKKNCSANFSSMPHSKQKAIEYSVNHISKDGNGKFYKLAEINKQEIRCYIDFGSECSLITTTAADNLALEKKTCTENIILSTIAGAEIKPRFLVTATLNIQNVIRTIEFYVIDNSFMGVEVLVGQNFTELPNVNYSKINNQLNFAEPTRTFNVNATNERVINIGVNDSRVEESLILLLDKYSDCIANDLRDLGVTNLVQMKIELTSQIPMARRPRQFADCEREHIRKIVDDLLQKGIIRESCSPYASQVLLVDKKTGDKRLCVDYRELNKITVPEKYPLPIIEDQLRRLSGFRYFISLDLFSGYYHIPMAPESVPLTAFITQDGHYEFLRVPFGLTNAPAVFQRMLHSALGNLRFSKVVTYLDDILIPTKDVADALQILEEVLLIFRKHGLTLNLKKCYFLQTKIEYLGYQISATGVQPSERKIEAVAQFPIPTNVHCVRQYLGLTGYFRKFVRDYALKAKPLSSLLLKEAPWKWGQEQVDSFNVLKESLLSSPILALFDPRR